MPRSEKGSAATPEVKDLSELDQPNGLLLTNDTHGYLDNAGAVADASGGCSAAMLPRTIILRGPIEYPALVLCAIFSYLLSAQHRMSTIPYYLVILQTQMSTLRRNADRCVLRISSRIIDLDIDRSGPIAIPIDGFQSIILPSVELPTARCDGSSPARQQLPHAYPPRSLLHLLLSSKPGSGLLNPSAPPSASSPFASSSAHLYFDTARRDNTGERLIAP
ncbi:hypothetical protein PSPO01_15492 [Paraphaeosphaeria sporulosa]